MAMYGNYHGRQAVSNNILCGHFFWFILQPDISKYSADILPLLFERLVNSSSSGKSSASITRTYYALETFCENLGKQAL